MVKLLPMMLEHVNSSPCLVIEVGGKISRSEGYFFINNAVMLVNKVSQYLLEVNN